MEILRMWGLAESYRSVGVAPHELFNEIYVTSVGPGGRKLSTRVSLQWSHHSV